jgi:hypothetical protein
VGSEPILHKENLEFDTQGLATKKRRFRWPHRNIRRN